MLRNTLNTVITATLIMLLGVSSSASAQTIVPMGDLMGSTSVTWGNDNEETTKSSALRVDLVPAEPKIKQVETDAPGNEQLPGEPVTVTYTITSEANGPDDYALATDYDDGAAAEANLVDSPTTEILGADGQPASVNLGATAATGPTDKDSRTITVLCDAASSSEISCNGIDALDTVIIGDGDTASTVATGGVSNTGDGPSTIRLDDGVALPSIVVGTRIAEQKTFEVVVTGVALRDPAEPGAVSLAVTGTSTDGNQGQELLAFDVTANPIPRSVDRYVRNLTDPNRNPAADADVESTQFQNGELVDEGGVNYYKTGVSAEEGDEVEILIVMKAGNLADQTGIRLEDTLSPFVEYIDGSTLFFANGGEEGADMARLSQYERTLELNAPEGQRTIDLAKNTSAHLTYQVTVIGGVGDGEDATWIAGGLNDECRHDADGLWAPNIGMDATKCKGGKWNAANGPRNSDGSGPMLEHNPVCWDRKSSLDGWQEDGVNPWVVGTAAEHKYETYDCRERRPLKERTIIRPLRHRWVVG